MEKFVCPVLVFVFVFCCSFFPPCHCLVRYNEYIVPSLRNAARYDTYFTVSEVLSFVHTNKAVRKARGIKKKKSERKKKKENIKCMGKLGKEVTRPRSASGMRKSLTNN